MLDPTPELLLAHPELVLPVAPWCSWLENHELGILFLAQPGLAGGSLRRSDLQDQLERLATTLPLGPVYFQRVSRAAEILVARGQLREQGAGRTRRYQGTAGGLAAVLLNLQVLRADPTVDGSEFELKRALVALWNMVAERLEEQSGGMAAVGDLAGLLEGVSRLKVWGRAVITDEVVNGAFDILRLIRTQRARIASFEEEIRQRQRVLEERCQLVEPARGKRRQGEVALAEALASVQVVATGLAPRLEGEAALLRHRAYLEYLDGLERLYARQLRVVDLTNLRRAARGRGR